MPFNEKDRGFNDNMPEWGLGVIIADLGGNRFRIFFEGAGERTISCDHASLSKAGREESRSPILDHFKVPSDPNRFMSHSDMVTRFLELFPDGFEDADFYEHERNYKMKAVRQFHDTLSQETIAGLIQAEDFDTVCSNAQKVLNKTNLVFPNEKMALSDALKASPANREKFARSLADQLYGTKPDQERFTAFAAMLMELEAAKWTTFTYFTFIGFPEKHLFFKPEIAKKTAEAFGFNLKYESQINWNTYNQNLILAEIVRERLEMQGDPLLLPKDMIDVQGFMYCTVKYPASEAAASRGRSADSTGSSSLPESFSSLTEAFDFLINNNCLPSSYIRMLTAHYEKPGRRITATELAEAAGFANFNAANLHYGKLGQMIGRRLSIAPPLKNKDGSPVWTSVLADDGCTRDEWTWVMRDEVAEALSSTDITD